MAIINVFTLTVLGLTLDVYKLQMVTFKVDPRAVRVKNLENPWTNKIIFFLKFLVSSHLG